MGILVLIGIVSFMISAFLTGRIKRAYEILPFNHDIYIKESIRLYDFAKQYQPLLYDDPQQNNPKLLRTWYEVVENKETYDIIYSPCRENEKSSNWLHNTSYAIFRSVYYGYPLYDIESILVKVDKKSGDVIKYVFETPFNHYSNPLLKEGANFFVEHYINTLGKIRRYVHSFKKAKHHSARHCTTSLEKVHNDMFRQTICKKGKNTIVQNAPITLHYEDTHIKLATLTRNHLLGPLTSQNKNIYTQNTTSKLKNLTDEDYKTYKFARKSQTEHKTKAPAYQLILVACLFFIIGIAIFKGLDYYLNLLNK
ncbi:MAG: hypothetical protein LBO09_07320 [Candidatus Peribacteria bacterium]|jgi:hypothetical protein|nr:hypothetical protein [Candidatus Peribacteria bacterium]